MARLFSKLFESPSGPKLSEEDKIRAKEIAIDVKTVELYQKLEERVGNKRDQAHNADERGTIEKHEHEADVLELALEYAGKNSIGYWINEGGKVYKTEEEALKHVKDKEEDEVCPAHLEDVADN